MQLYTYFQILYTVRVCVVMCCDQRPDKAGEYTKKSSKVGSVKKTLKNGVISLKKSVK